MAQQGTSNQVAAAAPEGTDTIQTPEVTPSYWPPSPVNLGTLYRLPPELRIKVYEWVREADDATSRVRTLVYSPEQRGFYIQTAQLAFVRPASWGLHTMMNSEVQGEAERHHWVRLPARVVTSPGGSIAHPDLGLLDQPLVSRAVGATLWNPRTTVFYLDQPSLTGLGNDVAAGLTTADRFKWITDLLLDRRTFEHLFWQPLPPRTGRRLPDPPLPALPGLRRLIVGFLRRWQDVAVVEGLCRDVIEELHVVIHYADADDNDDASEPTVLAVQFGPCPDLFSPVFGIIVCETVLHTEPSVRALNRAKVQVVWAAIRQGVTRKQEIQMEEDPQFKQMWTKMVGIAYCLPTQIIGPSTDLQYNATAPFRLGPDDNKKELLDPG
ncbi:hypothetical protein PG993_015159 [Apiospora rasikravindrae]|uniref:Uncharacterized protein n=1 Tax=Apiospora rasikravindrae TaxID=990691 RepID=A0ABR1RR96_9PEZI